MANFISERGEKILDELRNYLNTVPQDTALAHERAKAKADLIKKIAAVPGSRSVYGYFKYQLFEKAESYNTQRNELYQAINKQIEEMCKSGFSKEKPYVFKKEDADALAYVLNDLGSVKKSSSIMNYIKKSPLNSLLQLLQPGGIRRYVAILLLVATFIASCISPGHWGILAGAVGYTLLQIYSKLGIGNSSDENNLKDVSTWRTINPEYQRQASQNNDSTRKMTKEIGSKKAIAPLDRSPAPRPHSTPDQSSRSDVSSLTSGEEDITHGNRPYLP